MSTSFPAVAEHAAPGDGALCAAAAVATDLPRLLIVGLLLLDVTQHTPQLGIIRVRLVKHGQTLRSTCQNVINSFSKGCGCCTSAYDRTAANQDIADRSQPDQPDNAKLLRTMFKSNGDQLNCPASCFSHLQPLQHQLLRHLLLIKQPVAQDELVPHLKPLKDAQGSTCRQQQATAVAAVAAPA
jgi:hypothetical protein